jgi:hypothetical protein
MRFPFEVVAMPWAPGPATDAVSEWPERLTSGHRKVAEALETIRLALLLALDPASRANIITSWQVVIDPLGGTLSPGWSDTRQTPNLMPRQLDDHDLAEWIQWTALIHTRRTPSVAVAIRRILQAIAERRTPDDVLVDAIIVWENLFGASVETTLRVSSCMAWLLGTDAADRVKKQKDYKALYGARSDIVHGSSRAKLSKVPEQAQQAVQISIEALRTIFRDRADLLAIGTSEGRSIAVLLDNQPETSPNADS